MAASVFHSVIASTSVKQTTCPYCGVGCGVDVQVDANAERKASLSNLEGTPEHPANFGRLCVKGSHLLETVVDDGRLGHPMIGNSRATWSDAVQEVAKRFADTIEQHGPDSVAFYVSGQLLTEDYYVANKLMKGYIGSANIDTNSRLCMSSAVAAYKRAFGADTVPCCYEDLEKSDLLVFVGSNAAWTHPVLFQRIERARQINPNIKLVFIDPRKTASCELADLHLAIKPGTDVALFNGLLCYLVSQGHVDQDYVEQHVDGFDDAAAKAADWPLERVAEFCDLPREALLSFYELFTSNERVVTAYSMGVNQSVAGVDKANAIINCHLVTGKLGKEGCGPFSLTGQPNAMGGREVGGLANMLAAHMDLDNEQHRALVQEYWDSPSMASTAGLKAVDLFEQMASGQVKAVWIMATNPLVSMPNRNLIEQALETCEFVVVSDYVADNDTLRYADVKLPATGWSEKDGMVTNSERRISRQRALLPPYAEAQHDWKIISKVAQAMGFSGFDYEHPSEIFEEYAGLTAYQNNGQRDLDLSGLIGMNREQYDMVSPVQWPVTKSCPSGTKRLYEDGKFYTASGKARCIALDVKVPEQQTSAIFPFVLNSGRLRDQWHTMTRTGAAAELSRHSEQSFVAMHPDDAQEKELKEGDLLSLNSALTHAQDKQVILPVRLDEGMRRGELFAPIHWSLATSSSASPAYLYSSAKDPMSGQPELKHAAVSIEKLRFAWHGYLMVSENLPSETLSSLFEYWVATPIQGGMVYRFASDKSATDVIHNVKLIVSAEEWMSRTSGNASNVFALNNNRVRCFLQLSERSLNVERSWLEQLLKTEQLDTTELSSLFAGEPGAEFKTGRTVCSCFSVGENAIVEAVQDGCDTVEALGERLQCGTNCGSCRSELRQLITQNTPVQTLVVQKEAV